MVIYLSTRRLRQFVDRRLKGILHRQIQKHLQKVDDLAWTLQLPCQSLQLLLKHWTGFPHTKPHYTCILFGEDGYFLDDEHKEDGLIDGYWFFMHDDDESDKGPEN